MLLRLIQRWTSSNDQKPLGVWIFALKNIIHIDEKYTLNINKKTNKNNINEIEIKVTDLQSDIGSDYTILTMHVFLTTALIQCKGINCLDFEENIFPKIKGLVNKLTAISPTPSAPTINIDNAHQVARENKLPQIQPATKPKSTVYTNDSQTKDNNQPHLLPANTLDKKADKPDNIVDIPNLETSIVDFFQCFGELNLETLLKQILESQRSMSAKVSSLDNKLEKINKEHIDYRERKREREREREREIVS